MNRWPARLIDFFLYLIVPALLYFGGYRATEFYFRSKKIPYPFEHFGWATGIGLVCLTYSLLLLTRRKKR